MTEKQWFDLIGTVMFAFGLGLVAAGAFIGFLSHTR